MHMYVTIQHPVCKYVTNASQHVSTEVQSTRSHARTIYNNEIISNNEKRITHLDFLLPLPLTEWVGEKERETGDCRQNGAHEEVLWK